MQCLEYPDKGLDFILSAMKNTEGHKLTYTYTWLWCEKWMEELNDIEFHNQN